MRKPMADLPAPGRRKPFQIWAFALGTLLAAGLFVWAWQAVDRAALQVLWRAVPIWAWTLAVLVWFVSFVLRAQRLRQEWHWKRVVSWNQAMRVILFHNAAVLLLPMRAGEMGYPMFVKQVFGATWREALRSLMWLRLQDLVVLGSLAVWLWPGLHWGWHLTWAVGLLGLIMAPRQLWRWLLRRRQRWASLLRSVMHRQGGHSAWWLSLGNWVCKLTVVAGLLHTMVPTAMGWDAQRALSAALGGELAALIPIQGPAGLGTYEAGVWLFAGLPLSAAPLLGLAALGVHAFCLAVSLGLAGLWSIASVLDTSPVWNKKT
jgi:hypothetical protein